MEETLMTSFPDTMELLRLAAISSAAAYGWTEWAKKLLAQTRFDDGKYHLLWEMGVPIVAVILGGLVGLWLSSWPWGAAIGGVAGGFNAAIIKMLKTHFRKKIMGNGGGMVEELVEKSDTDEDEITDEMPAEGEEEDLGGA